MATYIWDHIHLCNPDPEATALWLERMLGAQWVRTGVQDYTVRFHWTWAELYVYRRSEYVRKETAPAAISQNPASTTTSARP